MYSLIILAAGQGSRLGLGYNKMFYQHNDRYLINITLSKFTTTDFDNKIIVVSKDELTIMKEIISIEHELSDYEFVVGGKTRQGSVARGLTKVDSEYVYIHDGARCNITSELLNKSIEAITLNKTNYVYAVKLKDSVRKVINNSVVDVIDRDQVYIMQTPQICLTNELKDAHHKAMEDGITETDEAGLLVRYKYNVNIIESTYSNIKVTTIDDLVLINDEI